MGFCSLIELMKQVRGLDVTQKSELLLFALLGREMTREAGSHENLPPLYDTDLEVLGSIDKENRIWSMALLHPWSKVVRVLGCLL